MTMRPSRLSVLALLVASACQSLRPEPPLPLEPATPRAWTLDDSLALVRPTSVAISPDGRAVLYARERARWETNDVERSFFIARSDGGPPEARPELAGARAPEFTPDGEQLSFVAEVDGESQVFVVAADGGRPRVLTSHAGGLDRYAWSDDGAWLYFTAEEPRSPAEQAAWDAGGDAVFVGEHGNGRTPSRWSNLWVLEVKTGTERRLSTLDATIDELDVAPDGQRVVFTARSDNRSNFFWRSELFVANRESGMVVQLTDNEAPEDSPRWSPGGHWIAYHAPSDGGYELTNGFLWLVNPVTGDKRQLTAQDEGELAALEWDASGKQLLFAESRGSSTELYALDVEHDSSRALTSLGGTLVPRAFARDGVHFVYSFEDHAHPRDLWLGTLEGGAPVRLTTLNPWVGSSVRVAPTEQVHWSGDDGRALEGVLTLPLDWDGATAVPLVLDIHGGPPGFWGATFEPEQQELASLGYAILGPNPRGSSSFGDEHLRALMGDVGGGELRDVLTGVDALVERGIADPERLALRGWSWGGILGAWALTQTERFKAASLGAMVGDWGAELGSGLMFDLRLHYLLSDPWDQPADWAAHSAQTFVAQVQTPTLLLHGVEDDVSTVNQSESFYAALRARGVPVRLVEFPRQGHDIDEPRLARIARVEELRWFERYVRGKRWTPPLRPDQAAAPEPPARAWLAPGRSLSAVEEKLTETLEQAHIAGLAAAIEHNGELLWSTHLGWAQPELGLPVEADTLFQLASISKTITAVVVMREVEAGRLDLDADIRSVLPFSVRHPAFPDQPLTARMLLTHSGGLRDNWIVLEGTWVEDGDYPLSLEDSIRAYFLPGGALYSPTKNFQSWAPGTRTRYSNVGFALLAYVAECAAGRPFEELAQEGVLAPLGIEGGYRLAGLQPDRLAVPQRWGPDGLERLGNHGYLDFAAGTLRLSARGLARFQAALQAGGALDGVRILEPETVAEMLRIQDPALDPEQGLCFYWTELDGQRAWGHDGGDPGVSTQMMCRADDGLGLVLLVNGSPAGRGWERDLIEALLEHGQRLLEP